ncbi:MAG TPA: S4 domain-containing protein [Xanthobacteraceae bacterium]|nr:S4 domain-containing protein [Xanthobacteraceae bacterium]
MTERHRLDVWIWHARCVRTRSSAAALIKAGRVRVNGTRVSAAGHALKIGDVVTLGLDGGVRVLRVAGFAERRGDAQSGRALHIPLDGPPEDGSGL